MPDEPNAPDRPYLGGVGQEPSGPPEKVYEIRDEDGWVALPDGTRVEAKRFARGVSDVTRGQQANAEERRRLEEREREIMAREAAWQQQANAQPEPQYQQPEQDNGPLGIVEQMIDARVAAYHQWVEQQKQLERFEIDVAEYERKNNVRLTQQQKVALLQRAAVYQPSLEEIANANAAELGFTSPAPAQPQVQPGNPGGFDFGGPRPWNPAQPVEPGDRGPVERAGFDDTPLTGLTGDQRGAEAAKLIEQLHPDGF